MSGAPRARPSPDERAELERRLGPPFALDGTFGSLWAVELLARTLRRVPAFRAQVTWLGPYLRVLLSRAHRETGLETLELGEAMLGVAQPAFVHNLGESLDRLLGPTAAAAPGRLSPVFGAALAPRIGLEVVTLGQPALVLDQVSHRPELERLVDWLVAEQLRAAVGDDAELGEAGYELVRVLVAPSIGYSGTDGAEQVRRVSALCEQRPQERGAVLRAVCGSQDLYLSTLAGRCCLELGISPTSVLEARALRRALHHAGGLPKAKREVLAAVASLLPSQTAPIEGVDHPRYAEADAAAAAGSFDRAYALLDGLCRTEPQRAAYFCYRGFVAERLGLPMTQSCADYDRALSLQPDYWQALINRGVLLSRNQRFADADRDLLLARALRPDCDDTRNNLLLNYWFSRQLAPGSAASPPQAPPVEAPAARAGAAEEPSPAARAGAAEEPSPVARASAAEEPSPVAAEPAPVGLPAAAEPASVGLPAAGDGGASSEDDTDDFSLYEVKELLGAGGMGKVYRVRHVGWDIELALKIPRVELLKDGGVEGFVEEAEAWSRLGSHPHTVDCYYVRMRQGVPWLFAEYVKGGSLGDWIESGRLYEPSAAAAAAPVAAEGAPPDYAATPLARMVDVALQMTYGLHHAHEHGLIHQDMKPANVILSTEGVAKVTDFGLAKVTRLAAAPPSSGGGKQTMIAGFAGMTPAYCSPEQAQAARARGARALTRRTDVWSWAATVLEMFMGELRWMNGVLAPAALERLLAGQEQLARQDIPKMPAPLGALLRRCFALDEAERPSDMLEIATELGRIYQQVADGRASRPRPTALDDVAVVLNNRGASMLDLGRPDAAMALWQQALDAEPLHPEATYNLSLLEWRRGRITDQEALEQVVAAVAAHRDDWRARLLEAWIHFERAAREAVMDACVRTLDGTARTDTTMAMVRKPYRRCPEGFQEEQQLEMPSAPGAVAISRDGGAIATGHGDALLLWRLGGGGTPLRIDAPADKLCISDDGAMVGWAGHDEIGVARARGGRVVRTRAAAVRALGFCGEQHVVFASGDRVLVLELESGALRELGRHQGLVTGVDAMADGRLVASSGDDGMVMLRLLDGQVTRTLRHDQPVDWISLTASGKRAVSGAWDRERSHYRLILWDTVSGSLIRRLEEPAPRRAVLTDDGKHVLSWSDDGLLRLWQVDGGRCLRTARPRSDVVAVHSTDADDVVVATADKVRRIRVLHEAPTAPVMVARPRHSDVLEANHASFRKILARSVQAFERHDLAVALEQLAEAVKVPGYGRHRDAQELAVSLAHRTGRGKLRASYAGRTLRDLGGPVVAVSLDANRSVATTVVYDDSARWLEVARHDTRTGRRASALDQVERAGPLAASAIARNAPVAATSCGGTLRLWQLGSATTTVVPGEHHPNDLALSADGRSLFVVTRSGVAVWDVARGEWLPAILAGDALAVTVAESADRLVVGRRSGCDVWALAARCRLHPLRHEPAAPAVDSRLPALPSGLSSTTLDPQLPPDLVAAPIALTPDAAVAAVRFDSGTVRVVNVATGSDVFHRRVDGACSVALADDGAIVLVGTRDGEVCLYDVRCGDRPVGLGRHSNEVRSLAISADGLLAASGGQDGDVDLWHLEWERTLVSGGALRRASSWLDSFARRVRARRMVGAAGGASASGGWSSAELDELNGDLGRVGLGMHDRVALEAALRRRAQLVLEPAAMPSDAAPGPLPADSGPSVGRAVGDAPFDPSALPLLLAIAPHRQGRPVGMRQRLPFRVLVVGAFGGEGARGPLPVDDVDAAMAACAPSVELRLAANDWLGAPPLATRLQLQGLGELSPDKLVERLGDYGRFYFTRIGLDWWANVADANADALSPLLGQLAERIAAGESAKTASTEVCEAHGRNVLAKLIPLEHHAYLIARGTLAGLLTLLHHHGRTRVDAESTRWASDTILRGLGELFDRVLHDVRFRQLERSWRSLGWLLGELPPTGEVEVHLYDTGGLSDHEVVHGGHLHRVLRAAYERDAPYATLVMDAEVGNAPAQLRAWAAVARHAQASLMVGVDVDTATAVGAAPSHDWRAFYADPASSHVALVAEPVLLRAPYQTLRKMPYHEGVASHARSVPLMGSGAYSAAVSLSESFVRDGSLQLAVEQLRTAADDRTGVRSVAVTLPLARLAQHLRLMHLGFDQRHDLEACRGYLRRWLDDLVAQLSRESGAALAGTLELTALDASYWRCDLWLMPRADPAQAVATSLLLERN